jgi:hypothetical protein
VNGSTPLPWEEDAADEFTARLPHEDTRGKLLRLNGLLNIAETCETAIMLGAMIAEARGRAKRGKPAIARIGTDLRTGRD